MNRVVLKDSAFRIIGYVQTENNGRQRAMDAGFRTLGYYEPQSDTTKDASFRIVARGNAVSGLVFPRQCR